jgi:hypothetical protein
MKPSRNGLRTLCVLAAGIIALSCARPTAPPLTPVDVRNDAVPATAPDFRPATLSDESQLIFTGSNGTVALHRSVLIVLFRSAATQAMRQAAIDSVGGTVIGGARSAGGPDGYYYVSIATDSIASQDSVAVAIFAAVQKLRGLTDIRLAIPYYVLTANDLLYQRPVDAGDWARWKLDPATTGTEHNWSAELMNLPNAWGCSVGDTATHVAVVDLAFHDVPDNSANVRSTSRKNFISTVASDFRTWHGDAVTDILAASGNDSIGMTGTAWKATVHQYEAAWQAKEIADYYLFPGSRMRMLDDDGTRWTRRVRAGAKPISRDGARVAFKQLEAIAKIDHIPGHGWYGLRRQAADMAETATNDDRVKDRLGGWQDSETRKSIYQDRETDELRAQAASVRR